MFVKDIHDLIAFLVGKNVATQRSPEEIDKVLWEVILDVFAIYYDHYVKTKKISRYLSPYKRRKLISITNGIAQLPPDFQLDRRLETEAGLKITIVEDAFWDHRKNRKLGGPSVSRPIARIEYDESDPPVQLLEVVPASVPKARLFYFCKVAKPVYAYTNPPGTTRYQFDEDNSVDVDFSELLFPDIKKRVLSSLGINLRDPQVMQYAEILKPQDQRK